MRSSMTVLAYLGPETILPMTSVVAGVAGVAMLLGRNSLRWALGMVQGSVSKVRHRPKPLAARRQIGTGTIGRTRARV